jgi:hypothetical protein
MTTGPGDSLMGTASEILQVGPRLIGRTRDQFAVAVALLERLPCLARSTGPEAPPERTRLAPPGPSRTESSTTETADPEQRPTDPGVPAAGDSLAIPGYDSLAASQVIPRLESLDPEELEAIRAYESAHRGRRTILSRIQQLQHP